MITEQDLQAAIAECEGRRNPNADTCMKLAAFYTIRDKMYPQRAEQDVVVPTPRYSYASARATYDSDTEFMRLAKDLPEDRLFEIMDEIMTALSVLNPSLYQAAIRKMLDN